MAAAGAAGPGDGRDGPGNGSDPAIGEQPVAPFQIADSRDLAEVARQAVSGGGASMARVDPPRPAAPEGWKVTTPDPLAHLKGEVVASSGPQFSGRLRLRLQGVPRRTWGAALGTALVVAGIAAVPVVGMPRIRPIARQDVTPITEPARTTTTARRVSSTTRFTYLPVSPPSSAPGDGPDGSPVGATPAPAPRTPATTATVRPATTQAPARRSATTAAPRRSSTTRRPATTSPPPPPEPDSGSGDPPPYP